MQSSATDGTVLPVADSAAPSVAARAWRVAARRAWPVLAAAALAANLMVLPEFTRTQLNPVIRAELSRLAPVAGRLRRPDDRH